MLKLIDMKKLFILSIILFLVAIQCKSKQETQGAKIQKIDTSGPEYTSAYICPMNCKGSGSDKPGICPVCGMEYEINENVKISK